MANEFFAHPTAIVESDDIGKGSRVWANAHVMPGARVGCQCNLADNVFVEGRAVVGDNVTVKNNVCVWDGVHLADDVFIGPNVAFTNDRFPRSPRMQSVKQRYERTDNWLENTTVERGVTIGANATICPGVTLGEYCFVAAGAVVTKSVAAYTLVAGSPASVIGQVCKCGRRVADRDVSDQCDACQAEHVSSVS